MPKVTITLDLGDLGQILDALSQRADSFHATAQVLEDDGYNPDYILLEEVTNAAEARQIARRYENIIQAISRKLP